MQDRLLELNKELHKLRYDYMFASYKERGEMSVKENELLQAIAEIESFNAVNK